MEGDMQRSFLIALTACALTAASASAQAPALKFRWQPGLTLSYKVAQATKAVEVTGNGTMESRTKLNLIKQWQVQDVDAAGVATLQLTVVSMRMEITPSSGETMIFDSSDSSVGDAGLKSQMSKYIGQVVAVLRVDDHGKVVEVKESKFGPPSRFEAELPFQMILPMEMAREGTAWNRTFQLKMEPPHGAGEVYECVQSYRCKQMTPTSMLVSCQTTIPKLPESAQDQIPLLQTQTEGEAVFDIENGRLDAAVIQVNKELRDHQGKDSSYRFQSVYRENYMGK
jgi:hypothetical protein